MKKIFATGIAIAMMFALTACSGAVDNAKSAVDEYNAALATYNEKTSAYNDAAQQVIDANTNLEALIDGAQEDFNKGEEPFDENTTTALKDAMTAAQEAKVATPEKLKEYEELTVDENAETSELKELSETAKTAVEEMNAVEVPEIPEIPDYTEVSTALSDAKVAYEDSVQGLKQITAPSDDFIMDRLKRVETITDMAPVTEDHDPNGHLGKQGGYIGCVYWEDSQVDRSNLYIESGDDVIDVGTDGGGAIEVFNTVDEANARNEELGIYDGTMFASGSHYVYGTIIIRTSNELSATQQTELTENVLNALLAVDK
ncbi:MAG: hypothetical protein E7236_05760 [Lachnospiraceae bacterium]|nr:hypothetical protein [Lachnospiraceae bacterium]